MLLAETSQTSIGQWGTFIVIVAGALGALLLKFKESKKEDLAQQIQIEQRDCMRQIEKGQSLQNGKLAEVLSVNRAYHDEVVRALPLICKAQAVVIQQLNQQPEKKKETNDTSTSNNQPS